ncbi:serine protease 48 [Ochotona curzoniae]|uniref:serine protease 48 n=1 Tax=Ochotona curzoniae TaxID=130825 RepID=UPI001B345788|nr:serine protease 48 [Ochotona curzoniae]
MGPSSCAFLLFLLLGLLVCGRPVFSSLIEGGQDAAEGRWPWQVSLRWVSTHICGGSLISESWILTAAHCIRTNWNIFPYSVLLGSVKTGYPSKGVEHYVSKIIIHPKYQNGTADIALLKLSSPVTFTSSIMPICLPTMAKQLEIPSYCWVTGWGKVKAGADGSYPSHLQEAELQVFNQQACEQLYNPVGVFFPETEPVIKEDMICAGDIKEMKTTCKGDSGGPLACDIDGVWTQIGVVSWGLDCPSPLPAVYTNVIYHQNWIKATISGNKALCGNHLDLPNFLVLIILLYFAFLGPSCAFGPNTIPGK